jgi:hypothetical protein
MRMRGSAGKFLAEGPQRIESPMPGAWATNGKPVQVRSNPQRRILTFYNLAAWRFRG